MFSNAWILLPVSTKSVQVSHQVWKDGQFLELAFGMEADVVLPYLFQSGRGDRCADFVLQVPSFNRVAPKLVFLQCFVVYDDVGTGDACAIRH